MDQNLTQRSASLKLRENVLQARHDISDGLVRVFTLSDGISL